MTISMIMFGLFFTPFVIVVWLLMIAFIITMWKDIFHD